MGSCIFLFIFISLHVWQMNSFTMKSRDNKKRSKSKEEIDLEALKNNEARYCAFFENSLNLMATHDMQGNFITINKAGADMIGCSIEEVQSMNLIDLHPKDVHMFVKSRLAELVTTKSISNLTEIITKNGEKRIWYINSTVQKNCEGEFYVMANVLDLTERYNIEQKLKQAIKEAKEANRVKSEFIANVTHEIRTPLNGIIAFTNLLQKTELDKSQQEYLKIINSSGKFLLDIVNQILNFSKSQFNSVLLLNEQTDLELLANETYNMFAYSLNNKNLQLQLYFQEDLPQYIWIDKIRLKQVLINLLSNAVKFTEKGEVTLSIKLKTKLPNNRIVIHFDVRDTGIGVHPDKIDKIFKEFNQADSLISSNYGGTGLGLTITDSLLKAMGSKLMLKSVVGQGSCFSFDLETYTENVNFNDELEEDLNKVNLNSDFFEQPFVFLIVEDNEINLLVTNRMLIQLFPNSTTIFAENGFEAINKFFTEHPHLVLMDVQMPNMNGLDATKEIRKREKGESTPIIALTAGVVKGEKEKCLAAGMDWFLAKPLLENELAYAIQKWLSPTNL